MNTRARGTIPALCLHCQKPFQARRDALKEGNGKFCSFACFNIHRITSTTCTCRCCGKTFMAPQSRIKKGHAQCCSFSCASKLRHPPQNLLVRFYNKTQRLDNGCLVWIANRDPRGYGRFTIGPRPQLAHRVAWEIQYGPITDDICILHHCDNPPCVEITHLFSGSPQDNVHDMLYKERNHTKLTQHDVRLIRQLYSIGNVSYKELAQRFSISPGNIAAIVKYHTWKHLK